MTRLASTITTAFLTVSVCSLSLPLAAQSPWPHDPNPALWQATPDAAALGSGGRGFLSYGLPEWNRDWMLSGGAGLFGGMLHATYGQGSVVGSPVREYAVGYARRLQEWNLAPWMSWGAGVDLTAAAQRSQFSPSQYQAIRLVVPFSFRLGSPSSFSIAPYVGPYAELGHGQLLSGCASRFNCTAGVFAPGNSRSAGLAFGAEITAWRLGLTVGALGVPDGMRAFRPGWQSNVAVRIRF
jgi:hypothetical protein